MSLTNHGRDLSFASAFASATKTGFDVAVGFNKMPGLDIYYCGDPCVADVQMSAWKRLTPRHRTRLKLERSCFGPSSTTVCMTLAEPSRTAYRRAWNTPEDRLLLLPPSIAAERARPGFRDGAIRDQVRDKLGCGKHDVVWLWLGTQPATKGLDRVLEALSAHAPTPRLIVAGLQPGDRRTTASARLAERLGVAGRVSWLGPRDDVVELMAGADLLVHPARLDVSGQVILEAIANGLPSIVTDVCGFAVHVRAAGSGILLQEPFSQQGFAAALAAAEDAGLRQSWSEAARAYGARHDFALGLHPAAELVEAVARARAGRIATPGGGT